MSSAFVNNNAASTPTTYTSRQSAQVAVQAWGEAGLTYTIAPTTDGRYVIRISDGYGNLVGHL